MKAHIINRIDCGHDLTGGGLIAVLFADANGVYSKLSDVDLWCEGRDARKYAGPYAVVAHPPCQLWGRFAHVNYARWGGVHNKPGNDSGCFKAALAAVRMYGGVLEHPYDSDAWSAHGIPKPNLSFGWSHIAENEYVCEVWQSAYGHKARKRTRLFYSGKEPHDLKWDKPVSTHQIGFHDQRGKSKNKPTISGRAASATPELFALELIKLAKRSK